MQSNSEWSAAAPVLPAWGRQRHRGWPPSSRHRPWPSSAAVRNRTKHVKPNISAPGVEVGCKEGGVRKAILISYFLCVSAVSSPLVAALPRCVFVVQIYYRKV